jgi:putative ABC transport system permease protein
MSALSEIVAVSILNIRGLPQRLGASLVVVVGVAGVVGVLISVLAMSTGLVRSLQKAGAEDRAIVVRMGASSEVISVLTNEATLAIADSAGIKRGADSRALASAESLMIINVTRKDGTEASAPFRGYTADAMLVHPEFRIVEGRMFQPSVAELVVGRLAQRLYSGLDIGSQIRLRGTTWTVVGIFASDGSAHESELIADSSTLNSAYQRGSSAQSVLVVLNSSADFRNLKDSIASNPRLQADVFTEKEFATQQADQINQIMWIVAYVVGGIMGIGAMFAVLNTMYSAVSSRSREIATLRAIGFGPVAMVVSVFVEALFLALLGGALGAMLAWMFFNGRAVDTLGGGFRGQLIFDLAVTPGLAALGIICACLIGFVGGLFPAIRAARLPVAAALRDI